MPTTRSVVPIWERLQPLATPRARQAAGVVSFALFTAISAKVALPMAGWVPFTFQTLAVVLSGALLGARLGAASQLLYLGLGIVGVPVFFGPVAGVAYLLGPTGGYLLSYPLVAFVVGKLSGASPGRNLVAFLTGLALIYAGGVSWLAIQAGWATAIGFGLLPFIAADLVKMVLAVVLAAKLRDRSRSIFST
jgi:biotin transport system substrate-specific component